MPGTVQIAHMRCLASAAGLPCIHRPGYAGQVVPSICSGEPGSSSAVATCACGESEIPGCASGIRAGVSCAASKHLPEASLKRKPRFLQSLGLSMRFKIVEHRTKPYPKAPADATRSLRPICGTSCHPGTLKGKTIEDTRTFRRTPPMLRADQVTSVRDKLSRAYGNRMRPCVNR